MRSHPRIWLVLAALLSVPSGLFIMLLGGAMLFDPLLSDKPMTAALTAGGLVYSAIGALFVGMVLVHKSLRIDRSSLAVTIIPLLGRKTHWTRAQIAGYTIGSEYTKLGVTQAVTLHFANGKVFTLTALRTGNFRPLRELIAASYEPFVFHPITPTRRKLSKSEEIKQRFRQNSPR